jgi:hypothetical protein
MSRANRKRGISILLWEFKSGWILPKRGERKRLRRQSHRLDRQMAKAQLRQLNIDEWTTGNYEIEPILPVTTSATGHTVYVGDAT